MCAKTFREMELKNMFINNFPFIPTGLFKGSTIALNNANNALNLQLSCAKSQQNQSKTSDNDDLMISGDNNVDTKNTLSQSDKNNLGMLSPFDEYEEWAKISEIMASFGSSIVRESVFVNEIENDFKSLLKKPNSESMNGSTSTDTALPENPQAALKQWLKQIKFERLEEFLIENGYDNINFLNGPISNENDLELISIPEPDRKHFFSEIEKLPKPLKIIDIQNKNKLNNNEIENNSLTVEQWLKSIDLEEYVDVFK